MRVNRISVIKRAAAAIGILAVPVVGISLIPAQISPADSGQNGYSCEGDCKPNPDPTVTQYYTLTVSPTPSATGRAHRHPEATSSPSDTACAPGAATTQYVQVPGPTVTRYIHIYRTATATSTP